MKRNGLSTLEQEFITRWRQIVPHLPEPEHGIRFADGRKWEFDWAWRFAKVAVELEGGAFTFGRHVRGKGYEGDCAKYNAATCYGWKLLRFTSGMLRKDPKRCMDMIVALIDPLPFAEASDVMECEND